MSELKSFDDIFRAFSVNNSKYWVLDKKYVDVIKFNDGERTQNVAIWKCIKPGFEWCRFWIREVDKDLVLRNSNCGYGSGNFINELTLWK